MAITATSFAYVFFFFRKTHCNDSMHGVALPWRISLPTRISDILMANCEQILSQLRSNNFSDRFINWLLAGPQFSDRHCRISACHEDINNSDSHLLEHQGLLMIIHISRRDPQSPKKGCRRVGIADRKFFARLEIFCAYLQNYP